MVDRRLFMPSIHPYSTCIRILGITLEKIPLNIKMGFRLTAPNHKFSKFPAFSANNLRNFDYGEGEGETMEFFLLYFCPPVKVSMRFNISGSYSSCFALSNISVRLRGVIQETSWEHAIRERKMIRGLPAEEQKSRQHSTTAWHDFSVMALIRQGVLRFRPLLFLPQPLPPPHQPSEMFFRNRGA